MAIAEYFGTVLGILQIAVFIMLIREVFGIGYGRNGSKRNRDTLGSGSAASQGKTWFDSIQDGASKARDKAQDQLADDEELWKKEFDNTVDDLVSESEDFSDTISGIRTVLDSLHEELRKYENAHPKTTARRTKLASVIVKLEGLLFGDRDETGLSEYWQGVVEGAREIQARPHQLLQVWRSLQSDFGDTVDFDKDRLNRLRTMKDVLHDIKSFLDTDDVESAKQVMDDLENDLKPITVKMGDKRVDLFVKLKAFADFDSWSDVAGSINDAFDSDDLDPFVQALDNEIDALESEEQDILEEIGVSQEAIEDLEVVEDEIRDLNQLVGRLQQRVESGTQLIHGGDERTGILQDQSLYKELVNDLRDEQEDPESTVQALREKHEGLYQGIAQLEDIVDDVERLGNQISTVETAMQSKFSHASSNA
jgi:prefoldin subunit 5